MNKQIINAQVMDTHAVIGTLTKEYKVDAKQAEGIVYAIRQGQNLSIQGLATKEDIGDVRKEISEVNLKLSSEIGYVRKEVSSLSQKFEISHRFLTLISMANFVMLLGLAATIIASIF